MTTEHKASIFYYPIYGWLVSSLLLFPVLFAIVGAIDVAIFMSVFALLIGGRLKYRKMVFSDDTFRYDGWFRNVTIPVSEIRHVKPASYFGYPKDRLHGGGYGVVTRNRVYWVHPLLFGPAANREFSMSFKRRGRKKVS